MEENDCLWDSVGNVQVKDRGRYDGVEGSCAGEIEEPIKANKNDGSDGSADGKVEIAVDVREV